MQDIKIQTRRVKWYFRVHALPLLLVLAILAPCTFAAFVSSPKFASATDLLDVWYLFPILMIYVVYPAYFLWVPKMQAAALRYWLDGTTLRIDQGVVFLQRKSIPLDRITDVVLAQGPGMRICGIWSLQIQTAGSTQAGPEGKLYGIVQPEEVRDRIMIARDAAVLKQAEKSGH